MPYGKQPSKTNGKYFQDIPKLGVKPSKGMTYDEYEKKDLKIKNLKQEYLDMQIEIKKIQSDLQLARNKKSALLRLLLKEI